MDSTAVGNDFVERGEYTHHCCARCLAFFGDGEHKFLGRVGCLMPKVTNSNRALYAEWSIVREDGRSLSFKRCFRCFLGNQECVSVPEALKDEFPAIQILLGELRSGMAPAPTMTPVRRSRGAAASEELPLDEPTPRSLSEDEIELRVLKLSKICKVLAKRLAREFSPHSAHLQLHSGAIDEDDDPDSEVRPGGRKRDNKSLAVRNDAQKRSHEASVALKLQQEKDEEASPRKRARGGKAVMSETVELHRRMTEIDAEVASLEAEKRDAPKGRKGVITKSINKLLKEKHEVMAAVGRVLGTH